MNNELSSALESLGDIRQDFCDDIGSIAEELLQLSTESSTWTEELANALQAKLHSIKGISGQMGFTRIGKAVHLAEGKIVDYRKRGEMPPSEILFKLADFSEIYLNFINAIRTGADGILETEMEKAIESLNFNSLTEPSAQVIPLKQDKPTAASPVPSNAASGAELALAQKDFDAVFNGISESLNSLRAFALPQVSGSLQPRLESSIFSLVQARVAPVKGLTARLKKLARELAAQMNKKVELIIDGENESMDRLLVSSLGEIMVHLLRNAMDHGLETAQERIDAGKEETATLTLRFINQGDRNLVSIGDNGKGIDPEKVASKAIASGLITEADATRMTSYEKQELIFASGLSTKETASEISGRGVGMDAVLREVEKLGGKLLIDSSVGTGTTFSMEFPSPYQIEPAASFRLGGQSFTVPAKVLRGIVIDMQGVEQDFGAFTIPGIESTFLNLHLPEIMPSPTDNKRPLLLLKLVGSDVCLQVDEITEVGRALIYRHTRTQDLPAYINGIGFNQNGIPHFGMDCTELERNLNKYLGVSERETTMFSLEPLPDTGVTRQQILEAIESSALITSIKEILASLESSSETKERVIKVISNDMLVFKNSIADIEDTSELQYMVAIQYANLKSKWISLNIQMQYTTLAGKEPDAYSMYMGSILSAVIATIEPLASSDAVNCITQVLAQPINHE
ncbi:MAG: Hpt domain-containing protein [Bdellovibrionaceae bacterium]|nr:Hpt domain-containing protein [Bdellovibrio sp.]